MRIGDGLHTRKGSSEHSKCLKQHCLWPSYDLFVKCNCHPWLTVVIDLGVEVLARSDAPQGVVIHGHRIPGRPPLWRRTATPTAYRGATWAWWPWPWPRSPLPLLLDLEGREGVVSLRVTLRPTQVAVQTTDGVVQVFYRGDVVLVWGKACKHMSWSNLKILVFNSKEHINPFINHVWPHFWILFCF